MLEGFEARELRDVHKKRGGLGTLCTQEQPTLALSWGEVGEGMRTELQPWDRLSHGKGSLETCTQTERRTLGT